MDNNAFESLNRYCEARECQLDRTGQLERDLGLETRLVGALEASAVSTASLADLVSRKLREAAVYRGNTLGGAETLALEMEWARGRAIDVNRAGLQAQVGELADLVGPMTAVELLRPLCAPRSALAFSDEEVARPRR